MWVARAANWLFLGFSEQNEKLSPGCDNQNRLGDKGNRRNPQKLGEQTAERIETGNAKLAECGRGGTIPIGSMSEAFS
jgi:hypothetical protein